MTTKMNLTAFDRTMKDVYPLPGTRIKLWVVEMRREEAWADETCPRLDVPNHYDDSEEHAAPGELTYCAGSGSTAWRDLGQRECRFCEGFYHGAASRPEVVAWLAAKAARPPITEDRDALSDEIAEDLSLREHPFLARKP